MKADQMKVDPATAMPPSAMSSYSYIPPNREYPKEVSYFNYKKEVSCFQNHYSILPGTLIFHKNNGEKSVRSVKIKKKIHLFHLKNLHSYTLFR